MLSELWGLLSGHHLHFLLRDEPFGALDSITRTELQSWLQGVWFRNSWSAVLITRDIREAIYLADRVVVLGARPTSDVSTAEPDDRPAASTRVVDDHLGRVRWIRARTPRGPTRGIRFRQVLRRSTNGRALQPQMSPQRVRRVAGAEQPALLQHRDDTVDELVQ